MEKKDITVVNTLWIVSGAGTMPTCGWMSSSWLTAPPPNKTGYNQERV